MMRTIEDLAERKQRGEPGPALDEEVVAGYERRRLTERLAELFDGVLGSPAQPAK
jgi:hypothetical protein